MKFIRPRKIFIVDDDQMLTMALTDYLTRDAAHEIKAFHTGEEALRHLNENPEIVILDYYLNSRESDAANGLQVLQVLKKNYPGVHVIMLSSQERYGVAAQTIQKGAEQYVMKGDDAFEKVAAIVKEM